MRLFALVLPVAILAAAIRPVCGQSMPVASLTQLPYNHPGLVVDLGVGLWAWPIPCDADGDGDLDLWIFAFQADRRILRTQRFLLEDNSPLHWGHLFDCGAGRNGTGYNEVTASNDPEAVTIRTKFNALLESLPAPVLAEEGAPNERKAGTRAKNKSKTAQSKAE